MTIDHVWRPCEALGSLPHENPKGGIMRLVLSMSLISVLAFACSKKEEQPADPEAKPATGEVKTEAAKPGENTAIANPSGSVGVAECDDYIAKMTACVDKLPEAQKAATLQSFEA